MSVTVTFRCGGCDEMADGTRSIRKIFKSVSGRSYGIGTAGVESVEAVTPEGWVAYDPFTYCTYCPACAAGLGL